MDFDSLQDDSAASPVAGVPPVAPSSSQQAPVGAQPAMDFDSMPDDNAKYETPGQKLATGAEGLAKGVLGPVATLGERAFGVPTEDIKGRAEANPITHGAGEFAGLIGGTLTGTGVGGVAEHVGAAVVPAAKDLSLLGKVTSATGKAAVENMVIQASDEGTNFLLDPNHTVGAAIADVGLAGLIGGGIGGTIGAISPLWKVAEGGKLHTLISDFGDRMKFRTETPDLVAHVSDSMQGAHDSVDEGVESLFRDGIKKDTLSKSMPEFSPGNSAKIDAQVEDIRSSLESQIKKAEKDVYLKGAVPKLQQHLDEFNAATATGVKPGEMLSPEVPRVANQEVRQTPIRFDENPNQRQFPWLPAEYRKPLLVRGDEQVIQHGMLNAEPKAAQYAADSKIDIPYMKKFEAIDELKRNLQGLARYGTSAEDTALSSLAKKTSANLRESLEDHHVWGDAGRVQKEANSAFYDMHKTKGPLANLRSQFFTNTSIDETGQKVFTADRGKIESYLKQLGNPKAELKQGMVTAFLESHNEFHNKLQGVFDRTGSVNSVIRPSTQALSDTTKELSNGAKLADYLYEKGATSLGASALGIGAGEVMGHAVGHPAIGALLGEHALSPVFKKILPLIAKPFATMATDAVGGKAAIDLGTTAVKGQRTIMNTVKSVFKTERELLPSQIHGDMDKDRSKLDARLKSLQVDPSKLVDVGGKASNYLPEHGAVMGSTAATAVNYLNSLRPSTDKANPLDSKPLVNPVAKAAYNRALDIANRPTIVLEHIKAGTLQPQDVVALRTMYPSLYNQFTTQLLQNMNDTLAKGGTIPYKTRIGLSMFAAQPLDSTMSSENIMAAQMTSQSAQAAGINTSAPGKTPPQAATKALSKMGDSAMTSGQRREQSRAVK